MVVQESYSFWKNGGLLRLGAALPGQTRPGFSAMMGIYQRQCKKWRSANTQAAPMKHHIRTGWRLGAVCSRRDAKLPNSRAA
jgi:hypothetical protein